MTYYLSLIFATLIWGLGFVASRWTFMDYTPTGSNTMRFLIAGLISFPFLLFNRKYLFNKNVLFCSLFLMIGLQLQTAGIALTTLAKSGFFTVFYALFTPLIGHFILGKKVALLFWPILMLALFSLALIGELKIEGFNFGDLIVLISALFFSIHILAIDRFAKGANPFYFNLGQCFYVGIFSLVYAVLTKTPLPLEPLLDLSQLTRPSSLLGFLILSVFSSILAFMFQIVAQKKIKPHIASLIFLLECIFAAIFGYLFFQETLSLISIIGCILLLISVFLVSLLEKFQMTNLKPKGSGR